MESSGTPGIERRKLLEVIQSFIRNMVRKWPHDEWKLAMNKNKIALLRRKIVSHNPPTRRRSRNLPWAKHTNESYKKRTGIKQADGYGDFANYCLQYQWDIRDSGLISNYTIYKLYKHKRVTLTIFYRTDVSLKFKKTRDMIFSP